MGRRFDGVLCGFWGTKSGEGYIVFGAVGPLYGVAVMFFWWGCGSRLYRYGLGICFGLLKKVDYEVCLLVMAVMVVVSTWVAAGLAMCSTVWQVASYLVGAISMVSMVVETRVFSLLIALLMTS